MDSMTNDLYYRGFTIKQDLGNKEYEVNLEGHNTKSRDFEFVKTCVDVLLDPRVAQGFDVSESRGISQAISID